MKSISTFLTLLGFITFTSVSAQEVNDSNAVDSADVQVQVDSSSVIIKTDTSSDEDVEVVITTKQNQDSTVVRVPGMKIIVLNDDEGGQPKKFIIDSDEDEDDDDDKFFEWRKNEPVSHWAGIRIGVNGYLYNDGLPMAGGDEFLTLDYGRSIGWELNLIEKDFRLYKNYIELVTGLGARFNKYEFEANDMTLISTPADSLLGSVTDPSTPFSKNRLNSNYLTAPLMLGFATNEDEDKAFRFAAGGMVSWRMWSRYKQKNAVNGNKLKVKGDYDLNPFLFHAVATAGYGPVNIYANYGLNPLFKPGKTNGNVTPFDLGLQLMF